MRCQLKTFFTSLNVAFIMLIVAGASSMLPAARPETSESSVDFSKYVDANGVITRPTEYRKKMVFLGSSAVASVPGKPIDEMHNVYTRPEDVAAFQKDKTFPDGAVLVKEVCKVKSEKLSAGEAHYSSDIKLWFVLIKDEKGRFHGNPHWGDGWAWGLYYPDAPTKNVSTNYKTDCKLCHIPAQKDDWVYVQLYPLLNSR
jgi:cytochrome P460